MTYKKTKECIQCHKKRIYELSDSLSNADCSEVRKDLINEMLWRAVQIGKLDSCNEKRLMYCLENLRKKIGF